LRNKTNFVAIFTARRDRIALIYQYTVRQEVWLKDVVWVTWTTDIGNYHWVLKYS